MTTAADGGDDERENEGAGNPGTASAPRADKQGGRSGSGAGDTCGDGGGEARETAGLPNAPHAPVAFPQQSPLFHAQHAERYARQELIRSYEERFDCRLVVMIDAIFPDSVTYFEELIVDAEPEQDMHLLLDTPGGDGETAIRLVRAAQARSRELTVIVPNQAKSAGTILALGAHKIMMGPTSDLGPIDPQFQQPSGRGLFSAKDLIAAVGQAEQAIATNPDTYPLHVSLLADVTAVMVQQARSALERSGDLMKEALASHPQRTKDEGATLAAALKEKLIDLPRDHGAVFNASDALGAGLPVVEADPCSEQWRIVWWLWTKYFALDCCVYEGRYASQVTSRFVP